MQQLLHEGSLIAATVGLRDDLKSVKAMMDDPLWDTPGGWKEKALVELTMVIREKRALVPVTHEQYKAMKLLYGTRVENINVMTLGSVKTLADGTPSRLKVRTVVTDVKKNSTFTGETYSGAVDDSTIRWLTAATLGRPGLKRRILDVKALRRLTTKATSTPLRTVEESSLCLPQRDGVILASLRWTQRAAACATRSCATSLAVRMLAAYGKLVTTSSLRHRTSLSPSSTAGSSTSIYRTINFLW